MAGTDLARQSGRQRIKCSIVAWGESEGESEGDKGKSSPLGGPGAPPPPSSTMVIIRSRRKGSRPSGVDEDASAISKRRSKRSKRSKGNQLGRAGESLKAALRKQKEALLALENAEWALIVAQRTRDKAERALWSADEKVNTLRMAELPRDIWQKIVDEYLHPNDMFAFAMTCKFFRDTTKDLGKKMETNLKARRLLELRKSGKMASHSLDWFGYAWGYRAVSEGNLVNYAAFQGSAEVLRWLMEEKDWELNEDTGWWAGMGGSVEVLEHLLERGYEFDMMACSGAARGGCLEALKFLRGLDPPCPWNKGTCAYAVQGGHLDVLKWARSQDPPCPWERDDCRERARRYGHLHIVRWIDQQEDESDEDVDSFVRSLAEHVMMQ